VSVNQITIIPTNEATIKTVNDIGKQECQPEGIEFSDLNGRITLQDFADNDNDEDSNASDDEEEGSVGNNDPDSQEDYFQTPIQQHNSSVDNNNEAAATVIDIRTRNNPVVTLSNAIIPENQEGDKRKKKNSDDDESVLLDDDVDTSPPTVGGLKPITGSTVDENDDSNSINEKAMPKELDSDLGPYWTLAQSSQAYVLSTITSCSNIEASKSTPQYGFNRGLKEFGTLGYEATVNELDDNLLGMGAVNRIPVIRYFGGTRYIFY
jgi:hypothetical protein